MEGILLLPAQSMISIHVVLESDFDVSGRHTAVLIRICCGKSISVMLSELKDLLSARCFAAIRMTRMSHPRYRRA